MNLKECYEAFGGDWEGVVSRMQSEERVRKFALKFLADPNFSLLCSSIGEEKYEDAFRAAHTLKGVCQNLGFDSMSESVARLTDSLRSGTGPVDMEAFESVKNNYADISFFLGKLD